MNFKHISISVGLIASSFIAIATAPAQAGSFNFTNNVNVGSCDAALDFAGLEVYGKYDANKSGGSSCLTSDGVTIKAGVTTGSGGLLHGKFIRDESGKDVVAADQYGVKNRVKGIGVNSVGTANGGFNDTLTVGEIGGNEFIDLIPTGPSILKSLDLSFLYGVGIFGDQVNEVVKLTATDANGNQVTKSITPILDVNGTDITNQSASSDKWQPTKQGGGWYSLLNPFGDLVISSLRLEAGGLMPFKDNQSSDFSLVGATFETKSVPEPATLLGLATAAALAVSRRRHTTGHKI